MDANHIKVTGPPYCRNTLKKDNKLEVLSGALTPCAKLEVYLGYTQSKYKNMTLLRGWTKRRNRNEELETGAQAGKTGGVVIIACETKVYSTERAVE